MCTSRSQRERNEVWREEGNQFHIKGEQSKYNEGENSKFVEGEKSKYNKGEKSKQVAGEKSKSVKGENKVSVSGWNEDLARQLERKTTLEAVNKLA